MKIAVWGLGYVGSVTAACLAQLGHDVAGIEPNQAKVDALNRGESPVKEPGLASLIRENVAAGRLRAIADGQSAVSAAEVSLICVGTPSEADGGVMLDHIRQVASDIGTGLRHSNNYHVVVLRSTVFPGTSRNFLAKIVQDTSGGEVGRDFGVVMNPEFMRETNAVDDFFAPSYTVIGSMDEVSGDLIQRMYESVRSKVFRVSLEEAEILKLCNNAFHALKIGFANEIGRLCNSIGIDSHAVMTLICADTKLNISPAYLKPGFAFGGSCLPKDLRSLIFHARRLGVEVPIIEGILPSNRLQVEAARCQIRQSGARSVGILGLSFKAHTDDLRESPMIGLIRDLWQDGLNVLVHDPDVQPGEMIGSNLEYLERQLPQIHQIFCTDLNAVLAASEAIVVGQNRPEFAERLSKVSEKKLIFDLVRLNQDFGLNQISSYKGISW